MNQIARDVDQIEPGIRDALRRACAGELPWPVTLLGDVGTGKTCAALCLLERVTTGARLYYTAPVLTGTITSVRRSDRPSDENGFWRDWREAALTCLDELGTRERPTDAECEVIQRAIDLRHGKPALIISNLTLNQLGEIYDRRIASRLSAGTVLKLFGWPDRRRTPGNTPNPSEGAQ